MTKPTAGELMELFGVMKRRLRALAAQLSAREGIAPTQGRYLWHIGRHARISQAELARATDTDPALTSRTVQALIDEGLVRRERSEQDRREYLLELTGAGRRVRGRVERARAHMEERIAAMLDERDMRDFERIAQKILAGTEAMAERD